MKLASAGLVMALAGCAAGVAGGDFIYKKNVDYYYDLSEASVFAAAGGQVIVEGAPRNGASAEAVASSMRLPAYLNNRELTAVDDAGDGRRLVLVFAPAIAASSEQVCAGEAKGGVAGAKLKVFGVFCTGRARPISEAVLETSGSPIPGDPAFSAAMDNLMFELFPSVSPRDRDRDCIRPGC